MNPRDGASAFFRVADWSILVYFFVVNSTYFLLLVGAIREVVAYRQEAGSESRWRMLRSDSAFGISMLAPAYNEAATIAASVQAMLGLYYPCLEVVVVSDGSTDATLEVLIERFELEQIHPIYQRRVPTAGVRGLYRSRIHPNLVVVDKENGGKADALNAALNVAAGPLVCAIDADTLIEPDALQRMVRPFVCRDDVIAAGGTIRVANGSQVKGGRVAVVRAPSSSLVGFQVVEYLRAFLFGRLGWNRLGGNLIISGAFGLFDREAVASAGGYAHDTVGEDIELVLRLRRLAYEAGARKRIAFIPDPVAWTEVPSSARVLGRQRDRWHRGLADVLWRHRRVFANPRYGALGLVVFPYFVLVELLAPLIEAMGVLILGVSLLTGAVDASFGLLFILVAYGYGLLLSLLTFVLEEFTFHRYQRVRDRLALLAWAVAENLGYRQLTVLWRLRGLAKFVLGRTEWGVMDRRGFQDAASQDRSPPPTPRAHAPEEEPSPVPSPEVHASGPIGDGSEAAISPEGPASLRRAR
ncbi:MAG: glycosyltransferase family 2 protein [Acidimicrobiales bacterium]